MEVWFPSGLPLCVRCSGWRRPYLLLYVARQSLLCVGSRWAAGMCASPGVARQRGPGSTHHCNTPEMNPAPPHPTPLTRPASEHRRRILRTACPAGTLNIPKCPPHTVAYEPLSNFKHRLPWSSQATPHSAWSPTTPWEMIHRRTTFHTPQAPSPMSPRVATSFLASLQLVEMDWIGLQSPYHSLPQVPPWAPQRQECL